MDSRIIPIQVEDYFDVQTQHHNVSLAPVVVHPLATLKCPNGTNRHLLYSLILNSKTRLHLKILDFKFELDFPSYLSLQIKTLLQEFQMLPKFYESHGIIGASFILPTCCFNNFQRQPFSLLQIQLTSWPLSRV